MQQPEAKYQSLLDTLTTYEFVSIPDLQSAKSPPPKFVRVLGKFNETKDGMSMMLEGAAVPCNLTKMRHKLMPNSTSYYECFGELVY